MFLVHIKDVEDYASGHIEETIIKLEVDTLDEAITKMMGYYFNIDDEFDYSDGAMVDYDNVAEITLYEVSEMAEIAIDEWKAKKAAKNKQQQLQEAENKERAEYERLKLKFGE